jgi:5'-AMP-activated protein kinase, regulatory gamma subunit
VYSRSDITFLTKAMDAEDAVRNLDIPVGEILLQSRLDVTSPDALRTCSPSHTLQAIFESFAQLRFNRLYVVDPMDDTLLGAVSARDLVSYFLRTDPPSTTTAPNTNVGGDNLSNTNLMINPNDLMQEQ